MELYTTIPIDSLQEITLTLYHSGSHVICAFCIETVMDVLLTVELIVGQFGEPVKYTKRNDINLQHRKYHCVLTCHMMCELPYRYV